ncbi:MAG TPA: hypothetical protein VHW25_05200 [Steroidobacteraceae bacterium]|jgi:hypothetical protein|nr:hypothetical protein [Steroidobacteraceae bacterium]
MPMIKAWRTQDPHDKSLPVPVVFRVENYRVQVMPGKASGILHVVPPRLPILIGAGTGRFARIEVYTEAEVLRETVLVENGQLNRYPEPFYKVWIEHLGQRGAREGYEIEAQYAAFDPITSTGEGVARLRKPDQVLRVAADATRLVRIIAPDGKQSTMEYANACVTVR